MKTLKAAVVFALLAVPAFAQSVPDLPRLIWPDDAPTTMGCNDPTRIAAPKDCARS